MKAKKAHPCSFPGCVLLVESLNSHCRAHQQAAKVGTPCEACHGRGELSQTEGTRTKTVPCPICGATGYADARRHASGPKPAKQPVDMRPLIRASERS